MNSNDIFESPLHKTLEAQVLARLREAILSGVLEPESPLNHVRLAEQFGVSRGPIRAALGKLEEEGLVNHVPHRGTFVSTLNHKAIEDLYNLRSVLEEYAAQLAVMNASNEDLDHFDELVTELRQCTYKKDAKGVEFYDFSIHKFIIKLSGNYFLEQFWSNLHLHVRWALADNLRDFHDLDAITKTHTALLEKFREQDADGAGQICRAHSIEALKNIKAKWQAVE